MTYDVLIVGSGASAVHAAFPMVEKGLAVGMLDVGYQDSTYDEKIPDAPFLEVRKNDSEQHLYFLGKAFEGIPLRDLRVGPQLTPPRQYIIRGTEEWMPVDSKDLSPFSSLALGGMASGWGGGAFPYAPEDLKDFPISYDDLYPHYQIVAERIGVSGEEDDLSPWIGELKNMLPPLRIDENAATVLRRYESRKYDLHREGFFMGKTRLAALSRSYRNRGPDRYLDMSFWGDKDQSVWRPLYTLNELRKFSNFSYIRPFGVRSFREGDGSQVEVSGVNFETQKKQTLRARRIVLGAGILGTTRIVLCSLNQYRVKVPMVCNPYTYYPMLNLNMLGKPPTDRVHSLAQLTVLYKPPASEAPLVYGRIHSYRSLLNFKVIKEMPLPYREGIRVMKILAPHLAILALDHEDRPSPEKYCYLERGMEGSPDRMKIVYSLTDEVRKKQRAHEKTILKHLRGLGCLGLKRVWPGYGASLHYGGTLPMGLEERPLTTDRTGRLRGTRSVYLVDSSVFPYLPSKGMTFTMMANANRIGSHIAAQWGS